MCDQVKENGGQVWRITQWPSWEKWGQVRRCLAVLREVMAKLRDVVGKQKMWWSSQKMLGSISDMWWPSQYRCGVQVQIHLVTKLAESYEKI